MIVIGAKINEITQPLGKQNAEINAKASGFLYALFLQCENFKEPFTSPTSKC